MREADTVGALMGRGAGGCARRATEADAVGALVGVRSPAGSRRASPLAVIDVPEPGGVLERVRRSGAVIFG